MTMRGHWLKCNETAPILHNCPTIPHKSAQSWARSSDLAVISTRPRRLLMIVRPFRTDCEHKGYSHT